MSNVFLLIFALAFLGCVLATPLATRIAGWCRAIDRPDQFRRIHHGAIPRLGGLGLAAGLVLSLLPVLAGGFLSDWHLLAEWLSPQWAVVSAAGLILAVGALDDTIGLGPRVKLLGQAGAVLVLYAGGIRIEKVALLGLEIPLSSPQTILIAGRSLVVDFPSLFITLLWFLGCMNVWNLIDGMDGLASGAGLLVSGTLMLVALHEGNLGSAALAAALAGSLAGFLLYNWHPACIFLGDSGSLLLGLLIGVIGVQDSLKGTTAVSILFPLLAMGLPISDTMMAIFRRWVRNLPLSSADRRHVHHLLIGLGLNPRQAALLLYSLTAFLCGVVLMGVAFRNEFLALVLGLSGCLAFLLILTSRRDELTMLVADLKARGDRKKQERRAAKETWEAIQRIELCPTPDQVWEALRDAAGNLGTDRLGLSCSRRGRPILRFSDGLDGHSDGSEPEVSDCSACFRLPSGPDLQLIVSLHQAAGSPLAADISFRSLQRLALATAQRLEWLLDEADSPAPPALREVRRDVSHGRRNAIEPLDRASASWPRIGRIREALGRALNSARAHSLSSDD